MLLLMILKTKYVSYLTLKIGIDSIPQKLEAIEFVWPKKH